MGGAAAKRLLEPIDDLSPIVGREPRVGDGGPRGVATELFELVALGGFTDGGGVERKALLASKADGKGSGRTGTVRKVNAFLPALGPTAIR